MTMTPSPARRFSFVVTLLAFLALASCITATPARISDADSTWEEDRTIDASIPGVSKAVEALIAKSQLADDLLSKLKASTPSSTLFESQRFKTWSSHISDIYPVKADEAIVSKLAAKYGDDVLASMLMQAKAKDQTKAIALRLEAAQLQNCLADKRTAGDVFDRLMLKGSRNMLVWNPVVRPWLSYVMKLDPDKADDVIYSVLKRYYTNQQLGNVVTHTTGPGADIAAKLKAAVFKSWMKEQQSADDVFNFLLRKHGEMALRTSSFEDWVSYVKMMDKGNPVAWLKRVGG